MKGLIACGLLLALAVTAQAKPAPFQVRPLALSSDEVAIYTGPDGAMLEQDYFQAPQPTLAARRIFPCRLQLRVFDKTQLAQSCN